MPASKAARQLRLAILATLMAMLERGQARGPTAPHRGRPTANLAYFVAPKHLKWEASWQGGPPNHVAVLAALLAIIT